MSKKDATRNAAQFLARLARAAFTKTAPLRNQPRYSNSLAVGSANNDRPLVPKGESVLNVVSRATDSPERRNAARALGRAPLFYVWKKWCPREDSNLHDLAATSS